MVTRANVFVPGEDNQVCFVVDGNGWVKAFGADVEEVRQQHPDWSWLRILHHMNSKFQQYCIKMYGCATADYICLQPPVGNAEYAYRIGEDGRTWYVEEGNGLGYSWRDGTPKKNDALCLSDVLHKLKTGTGVASLPAWVHDE